MEKAHRSTRTTKRPACLSLVVRLQPADYGFLCPRQKASSAMQIIEYCGVSKAELLLKRRRGGGG